MKARHTIAALLAVAFIALALYAVAEDARRESDARLDCRRSDGQWGIMDDGDAAGYGCR